MNLISRLVYSYNDEEISDIYTSLGLFFNGICPVCKQPMKQNTRNENSEILYLCNINKKKFTRRAGSIFYRMKTSYRAFNKILYFFSIGFTSSQIFEVLKTLDPEYPSVKTIKNFTRMFRSVIHIYIQNT